MEDEKIDAVMRIYAPDLEKVKSCAPPKAETLTGKQIMTRK